MSSLRMPQARSLRSAWAPAAFVAGVVGAYGCIGGKTAQPDDTSSPANAAAADAGTPNVAEAGAPAPVEPADASAFTWSIRAPLPIPRTDHGVAAVGGRIYALGGSAGSMLARVDAFDPSTNTWSRQADMLEARRGFATGVIEGKIYVAGGMRFTDWNSVTYVDGAEVYDPATNAWTALPPLPFEPAGNAVYGNLFFGGAALAGLFYVFVFNANTSPYTFTHVYDPATNLWSTRTAGGFAAGEPEATRLGDGLFVLSSPVMAESASLWSWEASSDLWITRFPTASLRRSAFVGAFGKLYAIGGVLGSLADAAATANVSEYDPAKGAWTQRGAMNVAREHAGAAELDGRLYVIGGDVPVYGAVNPVPSPAVEEGTPRP